MTFNNRDHLESARLAELARDRRIRRAILQVLDAGKAGPNGGAVRGRQLAAIAETFPPADRPLDDDHVLCLLRDLVAKSMASETDDRTRKSQPFGLDWLSYRITATGISLLAEGIGPDPDIDDPRL